MAGCLEYAVGPGVSNCRTGVCGAEYLGIDMLEVVLFLIALFLVIVMWPIIWRLAVALLVLTFAAAALLA